MHTMLKIVLRATTVARSDPDYQEAELRRLNKIDI